MIYDSTTRELKTNEGKLLKKLYCLLHKDWSQLRVIPNDDSVRRCGSCRQDVINLEGASDTEGEHVIPERVDHYDAYAVWNGKDFERECDERIDNDGIIG